MHIYKFQANVIIDLIAGSAACYFSSFLQKENIKPSMKQEIKYS